MRICSMTATFGKLEGNPGVHPWPQPDFSPQRVGKKHLVRLSWPCSMASTPASGAKQGQLPDKGALQALVRETHVPGPWKFCGRTAGSPLSGRPKGGFLWANFGPLRRKPAFLSQS